MTFKDTRDLSEIDRRRIRAREGNKVAFWFVLGAVGAAIVAGGISATSYFGTQSMAKPAMVTTGLASDSSPVAIPLPRPRPALP